CSTGGVAGRVTLTSSPSRPSSHLSLDGGAFAACVSGQVFGSLSAAPHTVSVKDSHNCPGSTSQNIGQPPALVVSSTKTDVSCNGGGDGSVTLRIICRYPRHPSNPPTPHPPHHPSTIHMLSAAVFRQPDRGASHGQWQGQPQLSRLDLAKHRPAACAGGQFDQD